MLDFIYRYDTKTAGPSHPSDPDEARQRLVDGNSAFAGLFDLRDSPEAHAHVIPLDPVQLGSTGDRAPPQTPFAVVLGCSDARAPAELLLSQASNELFVVRVAGTVLGAECLGSIQYAQANLDTLKIFVVLGHSGCGAATAAVSVFRDPSRYLEIAPTLALRAVIDRLLVSVNAGDQALVGAHGASVKSAPGYHDALIEMTTTINAALTALTLRQELAEVDAADPAIVYSVFDLATHRLRVPTHLAPQEPMASDILRDAPRTRAEFLALCPAIAKSEVVCHLIEPSASSRDLAGR
jgi:carbonic anhydrase